MSSVSWWSRKPAVQSSARTSWAFGSTLMLAASLVPAGFCLEAADLPLRRGSAAIQLPPGFAALAQQRPSTPEDLAEAVVRKALLAYGGEAKILSFTNATFHYQVETPSTPGSKPLQMKAYFKEASYFRSEASGEGTDAITILNRDKGWVKVGDTTLSLPPKSGDPLKSAIVAQLRPDLLLVSFQKFRYGGRAEEEGRQLDLVEVSGFLSGEYVRGRLSFDSSTHLIYKYEFEIERELPKGKGIVAGEEKYLRYMESEGLKVPAEIASRQGRKLSRLAVSQVDLASVLDPALFRDPAPVPNPPAPAAKP